MATMTTAHGLSVLTNASVKPPRNPKTGLSASLHERSGPLLGRFSGIYYDDFDDWGQTGKEVLNPSSSSRFAATADPASLIHLSNLSDEEFYQKLLELKNEQRKILQKCEQVYIEKHKGKIQPTFSDADPLIDTKYVDQSNRSYGQTVRSETFVDEDGILTSERKRTLSPERSQSPEFQHESFKQEGTLFTETGAKPLTGKPPVPFVSKSPPSRPRSAPLGREIAKSLDDLRTAVEEMRRSYDCSDEEYIPDDTVSEPYRKRDISQSRLDEMWRNFSIDDYAPRRSLERPSSAKVTRKEKQKKDESWRHRLTIPKPFTMTLREESKERKKSKNLIEFEEQMYKQQIEEEEELKKKFKARPVPAHVYLPLYDELQEKSQERRQNVKQASLELLKSQEKPFSFTKREQDKKLHQTMKLDCNTNGHIETKKTFKAKEVPKAIFDSSVDDKLMEEEEYRKIRIKMRAEEMLRTANLPPNMQAREQLKEQIEREKKMKSKRKGSKSASRPRVNHDVPNYDALYRQFQQELQRRKAMKEATVTKPFQLETERTSKSAREKIKKDIEREEQSRKEDRWPYTLSSRRVKFGHMSSSLDALPAKSTRSADCRSSKTRNHIQQLSRKELQEIEEDRRRRVKEMKLRREIQEKTKYNETPRETPSEKKKKIREAERARMEEYEREIQEMRERVNRRPLLFEQESQVNAKKKAEKKFNATLRSVGLDEDFVERTGSRSASIHDYTDNYDDDDDFEDTAVKYTEDTTYTKRRDSEDSLSPEEA